MSEVTAVPLRPIKKGSLAKLWIGVGLVAAVGVGAAWLGTQRQVAMAEPPAERLARISKQQGVVTTASGLRYKIIKEGSGPKASATDEVIVDYEGRLADGQVFDSSALHGGPAKLPVSGMISGWTEGLQLMSPGAKYRFWMGPELAFGEAGVYGGRIPGNAVVEFDVSLISIVPPQPGMGAMGGMDMGGAMPPHGAMPEGSVQ